mgnify:CR=1 FL=1
MVVNDVMYPSCFRLKPVLSQIGLSFVALLVHQRKDPDEVAAMFEYTPGIHGVRRRVKFIGEENGGGEGPALEVLTGHHALAALDIDVRQGRGTLLVHRQESGTDVAVPGFAERIPYQIAPSSRLPRDTHRDLCLRSPTRGQ